MTPNQIATILTPGQKYLQARVYIAGKCFEGEVINSENFVVRISRGDYRGSYTARVPVESILAIETYLKNEDGIKVTLY